MHCDDALSRRRSTISWTPRNGIGCRLYGSPGRLVALAEHGDLHDHHAVAAARYEWGPLMELAVTQ